MARTIDSATLVAVFALAFASPHALRAADEAAPDSAPAVVELTPEQVKSLGIGVSKLAATQAAPTIDGYAQVLDAGALVALLDDLGAAIETASGSDAQANRLAQLERNDHDVSRKSVDAARAQAAGDRAKRDTLAARVALEWSPVLAKPDAALVTDLRRGTRRLLRVELGADAPPLASGSVVQLRALTGARALGAGRVLGPANGAVATVTGPAWLVVAPGSDAHVGERLRASIAAPAVVAVLVPADAIVFAETKRWVFARTGDGKFQRRALPDDAVSIDGGVRVVSDFAVGDVVVVRGAGQLLAAERNKPGEGEAD